MFRQFTEPLRRDFDTDEEYQEAVEAYDAECLRREEEYMEKYYEAKFATL